MPIDICVNTTMLFGLVIGSLYAKYGFRKTGEPPKIDCSCGPIKNGMLYLCGYHVHHWMIAFPVAVSSLMLGLFVPWAGVLGCWDLMTFCTVMTCHGLSYPDRCILNTERIPTEVHEKSQAELSTLQHGV